MRLGANDGIGKVYGDDRYKRLKAFGFTNTDLFIGDLNGKTEEELEAEVLRQKALADEAGVTIWQVHGPWIYPPQDQTEERRAGRKIAMERSLRLTGFDGVYSLEYEWRNFLPNASNETRLKALSAVLEEIVP